MILGAMKVLLVCMAILVLSSAIRSNTTRKDGIVSLTCECGLRNAGKIVGGKETKKNEYPWVVSLNTECGGSILTPWHILTAAHCVHGWAPEQITVSVGRYYREDQLNDQLKIHPVSKIIEHEGYVPDTYQHDVAVLLLASKISFNKYVGPICFPNRNFDLTGKYIKIVGWGLTQGTGDRKVLREVDVKVYDFHECRKLWKQMPKTRRQLCNEGHKKDSCAGDSGGPLVYLDPDMNRYTQVALVSFGDELCGESSRPSVNTDVFAYSEWIKDAIASTKPKAYVCTRLTRQAPSRFTKG